jgi:hypothetical protein
MWQHLVGLEGGEKAAGLFPVVTQQTLSPCASQPPLAPPIPAAASRLTPPIPAGVVRLFSPTARPVPAPRLRWRGVLLFPIAILAASASADGRPLRAVVYDGAEAEPGATASGPELSASTHRLPAHRRRRPNHPRCRRHRPRCARRRAGRRHPCRRWSSGGRAGCSAAASLSQSTSHRDEPQAAACAPTVRGPAALARAVEHGAAIVLVHLRHLSP